MSLYYSAAPPPTPRAVPWAVQNPQVLQMIDLEDAFVEPEAVRRDDAGEGRALDEWHQQRGGGGDIEHVAHGDDVAVIDARLDLPFANQSADLLGVRALEYLERVARLQHGMAHRIDLGQTAGAYERFHDVAIDAIAGCQNHEPARTRNLR